MKERDRSNRAYTLLMFRSLDLKVCINPDVVVFEEREFIPRSSAAVYTNKCVGGIICTSVNVLDNTETGTLHHLVGTEVENLMPNVQGVTSLTVDVVGGKLYWTERTSDRTVRLDG